MKQIPLTKGQFALVDDEDFEYLNQWKWCAIKREGTHTFYAKRRVVINNDKITSIMMHRLIMKLSDPKIIVDHKDRNGLNNQGDNLRLVTHSQSNINRGVYRNRTSEYLGVYRRKDRKINPWHSKITINKWQKHLGSFSNEIDAAKAYNAAAIKYHGEFANLNKV